MNNWKDNRLYNTVLPLYIYQGAIAIYIMVMIAVFLVFGSMAMSWYWWLVGLLCIFPFFYGVQKHTRSWSHYPTEIFEKKLFRSAFILRAIVVVASYAFFYQMTGGEFDFEPADVEWYDEVAIDLADAIYNGQFNMYQAYIDTQGGAPTLSDSGYVFYLGLVYALVGKSKILARIIQSVLSALTCLYVYRISRNHFEEPTARLAGIMCMWMPTLVLYCGLHLKETIMTFLIMWYLVRADELMLKRNFTFKSILGTGLIGLSLFSFRTVLGAIAFLALATAIILSSTKIIKGAKRTLLIVMSIGFALLAFTGQIKEEVMEIAHTDVRAQQQVSLQHRYGSGKRGGIGNKLVDNLGAAVFAPLIFTLPFPTMVETEGQEQKRYLHGGCFVKNIISGFTIFTMFMLLLGGNLRSLDAEWRKHVLPLSFFLGYLVVLIFSQFAHSERFHMPAIPLLLIFASYGITHIKPNQKWMWTMWVFAIFALCIWWNWFKLSGRGLI